MRDGSSGCQRWETSICEWALNDFTTLPVFQSQMYTLPWISPLLTNLPSRLKASWQRVPEMVCELNCRPRISFSLPPPSSWKTIILLSSDWAASIGSCGWANTWVMACILASANCLICTGIRKSHVRSVRSYEVVNSLLPLLSKLRLKMVPMWPVYSRWKVLQLTRTSYNTILLSNAAKSKCVSSRGWCRCWTTGRFYGLVSVWRHFPRLTSHITTRPSTLPVDMIYAFDVTQRLFMGVTCPVKLAISWRVVSASHNCTLPCRSAENNKCPYCGGAQWSCCMPPTYCICAPWMLSATL